MSQQKQISFISTANVDKLSTVSTNEDEHAFIDKNTKKQRALNPAKRPHSCLFISSDHSVCIDNELDEIRVTERGTKKSDVKEIAMEIFTQRSESLKKENKKEITFEMKIEVAKVKSEFASKRSHLNNKLDSIEFENANILEEKKCQSP